MPGFGSLSAPRRARLIGTPECPLLVDVRTDDDVAAGPRLIPGAMRHPFDRIGEIAPSLAGRTVVVICKRGLKLSEGAAAHLLCHGIAAETLKGGILAWAGAGLPTTSVGLSRQYRDDLAQLEAGIILHDALYRRARDGHEEGHDWPEGCKA